MSDTPERRAPIPVTPARQVPEMPAPAPPSAQQPDDPEQTVSVFLAVGGQAFFDDLVAGFYRRVADDPVLLPLYPDAHDLGPAANGTTAHERPARMCRQRIGSPLQHGAGLASQRPRRPGMLARHLRVASVGDDHAGRKLRGRRDDRGPRVGGRPLGRGTSPPGARHPDSLKPEQTHGGRPCERTPAPPPARDRNH